MKAMILCAGYGTRLGELTQERPKPMLLIEGRPILEYIIAHLARHGFDQIGINLHFMPEMIRNYFGNGSRFGVEISYSYEPELLGTAGGVKNMEGFLNDGNPFLIHYGDVITDQDFTKMLAFHRERQAFTTLLLHQRAHSNSIVSVDQEMRISGFLERPTEEERRQVTSPWVNSGICLCEPEIFNEIPAQKFCDFPRDIFSKLILTHQLFGFQLSGYRCAVDSPQRFSEVSKIIRTGCCFNYRRDEFGLFGLT